MKVKNRQLLLLLPSTFVVVALLLFPLFQIVIPTFGDISKYTSFLTDSYNLTILGRTLKIALITTILAIIFGLPLALWISRQKSTRKQFLLLVVLFPTLTNTVVRNFAWIIILGKNGVINSLLMSLHIIQAPITVLYTDTAIVLGSLYLFLPIMVTTLSGSANALDPAVEEAAAILGANPLKIFFKIIIPQLKVGLISGSIIVFAGTMTAYTTPQLLGGNQHLVMSTLIYQQSMMLGDWQNASVIAMILTLLSVLVIGGVNIVSSMIERNKVND